MKCLQCKKEFKNALVLYDGTMLCPKCKKNLTNTRYSTDYREIYKLSEVAYLNALISSSRDDYKRLMGNAIKYCTEAAIGGYPQAVVQMGVLYEKGFMDDTLSLHERWTIAYNFYKSICNSEDANVATEVKKSAARYLLDMLRTADSEFSARNIKFEYNSNKIALLEKFSDLKMPSDEYFKGAPKSQIDHFVALLRNGNSGKAPIFGFIKVTREELVTMIQNKDVMGKHYEIDFLPIIDGEPNGEKSIAIDATCKEENIRKEYKEGYLYFFKNRKNRHSSKIKNIQRALREVDFTNLITIIDESHSQSLSFRMDDINCFSMGKKGFFVGANKTIENIINHLERGELPV